MNTGKASAVTGRGTLRRDLSVPYILRSIFLSTNRARRSVPLPIGLYYYPTRIYVICGQIRFECSRSNPSNHRVHRMHRDQAILTTDYIDEYRIECRRSAGGARFVVTCMFCAFCGQFSDPQTGTTKRAPPSSFIFLSGSYLCNLWSNPVRKDRLP